MSDEAQGAGDAAGANDGGLADGSAAKSDTSGKSSGNGGLADGNAVHSGDTADGAKSGWYGTFSDGLDADTAKGWNSWASRYEGPQQFAKAAVEMRKNFDARIPVPDWNDQKASQSWWEKHGEKMGRPKEANGYAYDFKDKPWDDAERNQIEEFKTVSHRIGLSTHQHGEILKTLEGSRKSVDDARTAKADKIQGDNRRLLEKEWQFDWERNVKVYETTVNHYGQEDAATFKQLRLEDGTLVQNHPAVARMMTRVGLERMEDDRDLNDFNRQARMGPMEEIKKMEAELEDKYGASSKWPKEAHEKLQTLYNRAYGDRPKGPHQMYGRS